MANERTNESHEFFRVPARRGTISTRRHLHSRNSKRPILFLGGREHACFGIVAQRALPLSSHIQSLLFTFSYACLSVCKCATVLYTSFWTSGADSGLEYLVLRPSRLLSALRRRAERWFGQGPVQSGPRLCAFVAGRKRTVGRCCGKGRGGEGRLGVFRRRRLTVCAMRGKGYFRRGEARRILTSEAAGGKGRKGRRGVLWGRVYVCVHILSRSTQL